jgi:hypothetical protein
VQFSSQSQPKAPWYENPWFRWSVSAVFTTILTWIATTSANLRWLLILAWIALLPAIWIPVSGHIKQWRKRWIFFGIGCIAAGVLLFIVSGALDGTDASAITEPVPPKDTSDGVRAVISLASAGTTGEMSPVTGARIVFDNVGSKPDRHIFLQLWVPTPISNAETDSPERVTIIEKNSGFAGGPGGNQRCLEISIPELAPNEHRLVRVDFETVMFGDIKASLSSESCGKNCGVLILRTTFGEPRSMQEP